MGISPETGLPPKTYWVGMAYTLGSALCFGSMAIIARAAYASGVDIPTLLMLRFTLAAGLLWGLVGLRGLRVPKGRGLVMLLLLGGLGYAGQAFSFFTALTLASAGLVSLLLYTYPALVALLAWVALRQPLSRLQVMAVGIALAGSALIIGRAGDGKPMGFVFGLLAALIYSIYILAGSRVPRDIPPMVSTTLITTGAAITFGIVVALKGFRPPMTPSGWGAVGAIGVVCTVMAILFFFEGMERIGPVRASVFSTVEPVFTVLLAMGILHEEISILRAVGGGLILGAVLLLTRDRGSA